MKKPFDKHEYKYIIEIIESRAIAIPKLLVKDPRKRDIEESLQ